ncbi:MAG: hypothetical protein LBV00_11400 [Propionibacteriaceae bacterium]|jgi:hypothetical protein|nr:hypothetical protein [Propionibacteriaceae bacterium]
MDGFPLIVDGNTVPGAELMLWPVSDVESKRVVAESPYTNGVWDVSGVYSNDQPVFKQRVVKLLVREHCDDPEARLSDRLIQWAGRRLKVSLPGQEQGHFVGSAEVALHEFETHRVSYWLVVSAYPWYMDNHDTMVTVAATAEGTAFTLPPAPFTVAPQVSATATVVITVGAHTWSVPNCSGRELVGLVLEPGQPLTGSVQGVGDVSFTWVSGRLL